MPPFLLPLYPGIALMTSLIGSVSRQCRQWCAPGVLHALDKVVSLAQYTASIISMYALSARLNCMQKSISCLGLLVSQRKVGTFRPAPWLMGKGVLLHSGEPEGAVDSHLHHPCRDRHFWKQVSCHKVQCRGSSPDQ